MRDEPAEPRVLLAGGVGGLRSAVESEQLAPVDVARTCLDALEERHDLNAVVAVSPTALREAEDAALGPLAGIPIVVKDCFVDRGRIPTLGSRAPARWLTGTARVLERLRRAGAVVVAYSNLHEWMVGTSSLVSAFGPVVNPLNPDVIAGGSSGGSAAAVAAGLVPLAVGSDAGGSIRIPAACCGLVGLKPSWGLVPTHGFVGHGSPIDHVGPLGRSVADVARLLEVLAARRFELPDARRLRLGVAREDFFERADPEVAGVVLDAATALRPLVASVRDVSITGAADAGSAVAAFILRDVARMVAADRADWRDVLQPQTARVVAMGAALTADDRSAAEDVRSRVTSGWEDVFNEVDVILAPTLPGRVASVERRSVALRSGTSPAEAAYVSWNAPMNLGGVPCLSLPCGRLGDGQSVSVSVTARAGREAAVLSVGRVLESLRDEDGSTN